MEPFPATPEPPVIEMTAVTVGSLSDPAVPVLEDVSWAVSAGEFWIVAGMHGSGKTDLMHMTAGLAPPQGGSYRLFAHNMPIYDEPLRAERLRLGLVFDGGQLLHELTVRENIALPLRYHRGHDRQATADRVRRMIELTGLAAWTDSPPSALGRNWQMRVGLARALILEPEILLLDQPLGGLDRRHAVWWLNFLDQLSAGHSLGRRMTLVVTVQDLRPWRKFAAHFALLRDHRFIPLGHCPELAAHADPLVRELLAEDFSAVDQ